MVTKKQVSCFLNLFYSGTCKRPLCASAYMLEHRITVYILDAVFRLLTSEVNHCKNTYERYHAEEAEILRYVHEYSENPYR